MASRDLHNHVNFRPALAPVVVADNTVQNLIVCDTQGYESVELVIVTGVLADADATFATVLQDGNASNLSDAGSPAAVDLLGTNALASFTFANDTTCFKIGYVGGKRYLGGTITPANNTGNAPLAAVWVLSNPHSAPTPNPPS